MTYKMPIFFAVLLGSLTSVGCVVEESTIRFKVKVTDPKTQSSALTPDIHQVNVCHYVYYVTEEGRASDDYQYDCQLTFASTVDPKTSTMEIEIKTWPGSWLGTRDHEYTPVSMKAEVALFLSKDKYPSTFTSKYMKDTFGWDCAVPRWHPTQEVVLVETPSEADPNIMEYVAADTLEVEISPFDPAEMYQNAERNHGARDSNGQCIDPNAAF